MCAALVGDLQWLMQTCESDEQLKNHDLKCFTGKEGDLHDELSVSDLVVMLTDQVPHAVRRRVLCVASANNVPVYMRHSSGAAIMQSCLKDASATV